MDGQALKMFVSRWRTTIAQHSDRPFSLFFEHLKLRFHIASLVCASRPDVDGILVRVMCAELQSLLVKFLDSNQFDYQMFVTNEFKRLYSIESMQFEWYGINEFADIFNEVESEPTDTMILVRIGSGWSVFLDASAPLMQLISRI